MQAVFYTHKSHLNLTWHGPHTSIAHDAAGIKARLLNLSAPCYVVKVQDQVGVTNQGTLGADPRSSDALPLLAMTPPCPPEHLGDAAFSETYGTRWAYMTGSMANAISGEAMVIALGRENILGAFGAGGLTPQRIETAIHHIQRALPQGPYAFNLIHSPVEPALEQNAVDLYLQYGVPVVEASAFLTLTPNVVRYRAAGLSRDAEGHIRIQNRVIAKLSRREVAEKFMQPAPEKMLNDLRESGLVTAEQAQLARHVPMADDITVEADSGGHTDNRPLVCLLPAILALRDEVQARYQYPNPVRVGAAGGISTPASALGAFMMGTAYVVTGSVNQSCVEAHASSHVKALLAQAGMADVMMAPAADMFEMGVKLQVLKRGTLFPMRAQKLFELYKTYESLEALPSQEREKLERQVFQRDLETVWEDCVTFFNQRDPSQIVRAARNPKRKMALVFRWYLGQASRWAIRGEAGREMDYQIWCGPAMGAFNDWVRGSYLEAEGMRTVYNVAYHIMHGAAYGYRVQDLRFKGARLPAGSFAYRPKPCEQAKE